MRPPGFFALRNLPLDVRLVPAGVSAEALGLRKLLAPGELDPDRGQHRAPVADVGAAYGGLLARFEDRAVGPVARDDVFDVNGRAHRLTERASVKPGASRRAFRTSSGAGSSIVIAMAAGEPGALRPTAMLPMLIPCSPRMLPTLPIMPGWSSLRIKSVCFCGTISTVKPKASTIRGCIRGPTRVPLTTLSSSLPSEARRNVTRLV